MATMCYMPTFHSIIWVFKDVDIWRLPSTLRLILDDPVFRSSVVDFKEVSYSELDSGSPLTNFDKISDLFSKAKHLSNEFKIYSYGMMVLDTQVYLPWLMRQLEQLDAM